MKYRFLIWMGLGVLSCTSGCKKQADTRNNTINEEDVVVVLKDSILKKADLALKQPPITVTADTAYRSAGGIHDFYSEGDYWWPDHQNPNGVYIQKDGMSNPDNFVAHRLSMIRFSEIVGILTSAYKITGDKKYALKALTHMKSWFVDPQTLMNPSLLYAQAIKGKVTGRGIGIIDTIHLMEVAQSLYVIQNTSSLELELVDKIKKWFSEYLFWLTSHKYGKKEMSRTNNHATCWFMQVASFAKLTGNTQILDFCREKYKTVLLPNQMAVNGSFPEELARTKPYGYSLFNLDAMTILVQIISDDTHDLWNYKTPDGKCIKKGIEYLYPFVENKNLWQLKPDVMYWENWPVAQSFLIFGAKNFNNKKWFKTWENLKHYPRDEEVVRNFPIRNPIIWFNHF